MFVSKYIILVCHEIQTLWLYSFRGVAICVSSTDKKSNLNTNIKMTLRPALDFFSQNFAARMFSRPPKYELFTFFGIL